MPSTLNCSGRRRQPTRNTARLGRRCSGFCGHKKISSDSSRMRHRSRTGSRADKRNTPKVDFASAFGVFFVYTRMEAFQRNAQPASNGCSLKRVWEVPNKHFCAGPEGHDAKNATWYQVALLAGFSYPVFLPFRAVFLQTRKEDAYTSSFSSSASFNLMAPSMTPSVTINLPLIYGSQP